MALDTNWGEKTNALTTAAQQALAAVAAAQNKAQQVSQSNPVSQAASNTAQQAQNLSNSVSENDPQFNQSSSNQNPSPSPQQQSTPAPVVHQIDRNTSGYTGHALDVANNNIAHNFDANSGGSAAQAMSAQQAAAAQAAAKPAINTDTSGFTGHALAVAQNNVAHGMDADANGSATAAAQQQAADAAANTTSTITVPDPTADPTYKEQHADYAKALQDFIGNQTLAGSQYNTSYGRGLQKLGWNGNAFDQNNSNGSYGQSFQNNAEDFASRGAYNSGQYGKSVGDINQYFGDQKTDLDQAKADFGQSQGSARQQYTDQNNTQDRNALRDAISRIASKYGVDPGDINTGSTTTVVRDANGKQVSAK